jgi:hypothetical protein
LEEVIHPDLREDDWKDAQTHPDPRIRGWAEAVVDHTYSMANVRRDLAGIIPTGEPKDLLASGVVNLILTLVNRPEGLPPGDPSGGMTKDQLISKLSKFSGPLGTKS